jgi:hypothetical protein
MAERLSQTGSKIAELSKQAASATKDAMVKVADAGKGAVAKTNQAVTNAVEAKKERKEEKLTEKIEQTKAELKDDGFIEVAPAMITLPEFEEERMALMAEEHDILVDLVDHMHALSTRIDQLENTYRALAIEDKAKIASQSRQGSDDASGKEPVATSQGMTAALSLLGASLVWVVLLTGIDRYLALKCRVDWKHLPCRDTCVGIRCWFMGGLCPSSAWKSCAFFESFNTDVGSNWSRRWNHNHDGLVAERQHHLNDVKCLDMGYCHRRSRIGLVKFGGECLA